MLKTIERTQGEVDSLIERTREAVTAASDRAEQGVETVADQVVEKAHDAGASLRSTVDSASAGAHRRVAGAAQSIDRGYSRVQSDLAHAATAATDYVTAHPGKSLLLAAAAGFVLGLLVRGRSRSA